jgi:isoleucyl-tRNA synthetase
LSHFDGTKFSVPALEASVRIRFGAEPRIFITSSLDLAEIAITSDIEVIDVPGEKLIEISKTTHHKCGRCWRHLPEVSKTARCAGGVRRW